MFGRLDFLDFIPGFDPNKEQVGAVRQFFGAGQPQRPQRPQMQGGGGDLQIGNMQNIPGSLAGPLGPNPYGDFREELPMWKKILLPNANIRGHADKRNAAIEWDTKNRLLKQEQEAARQAAIQQQQERERNIQNVMQSQNVDRATAESLIDNAPLMGAFANNKEAYTLDELQERHMPMLGQTGKNSNAQTVIDQKNRGLAVDEQNADSSAIQAQAAMKRANRDPSNFELTLPDGTVVRSNATRADQGADATYMGKLRQQRDDMASLLNTLYAQRSELVGPDGVPGTEDDLKTGGFAKAELEARRLVPGVSERETRLDNFDGLSKEYGIDKLSGIGGNDTERELLTAIQTGGNLQSGKDANLKRVERQLAVIEFISESRAEFASRWKATHGGFTGVVAQSGPYQGMTYDEALSAFQREEASRRGLMGNQPEEGSASRDRLNDPDDLPGFSAEDQRRLDELEKKMRGEL